MSANLTQREEVDAVWFDSDGVRYSVPVNAKKPNMFIYFYPSFNQPFGKNRQFTLSMYGSLNYNRNISYQAVSQLDGLDVDAFDYYEFALRPVLQRGERFQGKHYDSFLVGRYGEIEIQH